MDIFSVFTLCGGLAFYLYGMSVMSAGLEKNVRWPAGTDAQTSDLPTRSKAWHWERASPSRFSPLLR